MARRRYRKSFSGTPTQHRKQAGLDAEWLRRKLHRVRRGLAYGSSCATLVRDLEAAAYQAGTFHAQGMWIGGRYSKRQSSVAVRAIQNLRAKVVKACTTRGR